MSQILFSSTILIKREIANLYPFSLWTESTERKNLFSFNLFMNARDQLSCAVK